MQSLAGLARWRMTRKLGAGISGSVYQARDITGNHPDVAVKVVEKARLSAHSVRQAHDTPSTCPIHHLSLTRHSSSHLQLALTRQEAQIMHKFNHPNVVRLEEFYEMEEFIFLILELCPGGELSDKIISKRRFDEEAARHIFRQLVNGIEHIHSKGVAHR